MRRTVVVDASALVRAADHEDVAAALVLRHLQSRYDVRAPAILASELGNVAHRKQAHDFGRDAKERAAVVELLLEGIDLVPSDERHRASAGSVATASNLSFYDAEYLAEALAPGSLLLTTDRTLLAAAKDQLGPQRAMTVAEAQAAIRGKLL